MSTKQVWALLTKLNSIKVAFTGYDESSVTIKGSDYYKVLTLAKGGRFQTTPIGTDRIMLT